MRLSPARSSAAHTFGTKVKNEASDSLCRSRQWWLPAACGRIHRPWSVARPARAEVSSKVALALRYIYRILAAPYVGRRSTDRENAWQVNANSGFGAINPAWLSLE